MQISIRFFAHLGDIAGRSQRTMNIDAKGTVADIQVRLAGEDARFAESFRYCRIAINDEWAAADSILSEGDEVSLLPPVSGG